MESAVRASAKAGRAVDPTIYPTTDPTFYPIEEKVGEDILQRWIVELLRPLVDRWFRTRAVRAFVGADSLGYLSLDGLVEASGAARDGFCRACFDGEYPVEVPDSVGKFVLEPQLELPTP